MKIETLDDWNALGCCCPMPGCPVPVQECQSLFGTGQVGFVIYNTRLGTYYRTTRTGFSGGGFTQRQSPSAHWTNLGGQSIEPYHIDYTNGDPRTGAATTTESDPVDVEASRQASFAAMAQAVDWENMYKGSGCWASRSHPSPYGWFPAYHLYAAFVRFRWVVPDYFKGRYFKITWDVVEEPDGWDEDPPTAQRSFFAQDQTWVWTGPGDPDNADSWKSGWYEIPPPAVAGVRRVVNIRYECYRSATLGTKPEVTGDAVEL